MLKKAADLFQRQGFHATGLKQILEESGAPRGSLYFHFPGGKEQLAVEALRESGERTTRAVEAILESESDPAVGLRKFFLAMAGVLRASEFRDGCPIATVTLEVGATSAPIRAACAASYAEWQQLIEERLLRAGLAAERAGALAVLSLAAVEGGLILSRARLDTEPLETVAEQLTRIVAAAIADKGERPRVKPRKARSSRR